LKQVYKIDNVGFYIEPVIIEGEEQEGLISFPIPEGLYKPKWNGEEWEEGLTQEEIEELKSTPTHPTSEEKIQQLEAELAIAKEDNISNMLAITEIYELMLGGGA
jgi:hypothetical protein